MADDDLRTEYHLTPAGWVQGTSRYFGNVSGNEVDRPKGAVETWETHLYQRSMWSREKTTVSMLWHDASVPEAKREALRAKFVRPF